MRGSTVLLQAICFGIGLLAILVGVASPGVLGSSIVFGSVLFFFAAILGADPISNPDSVSRRRYKVTAAMLALPACAVGVLGVYESAQAGQWGDAALTLMQLLVFAAYVVGLAFSDRPGVGQLLRRMGLSTEATKP